MRRLGMAVAAVLLCATMGFARENRNNVSKEPFAINFEKLSNYLQLSSYQANEVANINEYFLDMQGKVSGQVKKCVTKRCVRLFMEI